MIIECNTSHVGQLNDMLSYFHTKITIADMEDNPFSIYLGYELNHELTSFINFNIMYEQAELNYIYVKPEYRGTKLGTLLMEEMFKKCRDKGVNSITLEVRSSNDGALHLYKSVGFEEISIRKNYYNGEDALLLKKVLK